MINRRFTTIAIALAAISASASTEVSAKNSKPFIVRNRNGVSMCRNIGASPKLTVCVGGKGGSGRVSDAAIKSAALSIKKMALVYGAKYSTLSASQVAKFSTVSCGEEPARTDEVGTGAGATPAEVPGDEDSRPEESSSSSDEIIGTEGSVDTEAAITAEAEAAIAAEEAGESSSPAPSAAAEMPSSLDAFSPEAAAVTPSATDSDSSDDDNGSDAYSAGLYDVGYIGDPATMPGVCGGAAAVSDCELVRAMRCPPVYVCPPPVSVVIDTTVDTGDAGDAGDPGDDGDAGDTDGIIDGTDVTGNPDGDPSGAGGGDGTDGIIGGTDVTGDSGGDSSGAGGGDGTDGIIGGTDVTGDSGGDSSGAGGGDGPDGIIVGTDVTGE